MPILKRNITEIGITENSTFTAHMPVDIALVMQ
jgi:hypothetical protein